HPAHPVDHAVARQLQRDRHKPVGILLVLLARRRARGIGLCAVGGVRRAGDRWDPAGRRVVRLGPQGIVVRGSLSIIIPAYNEADNILETLENVTKALAPLDLEHEILVIDDGSADETAALVTSNLHRFPHVTLLANERNMGFGWSYRRGVDAASLDHIVMVHGDNAWGHETLREFFSRVGDADVIIGYTRDMWGSRTKTRTLISKAYTLVVNLITRRRLK